MKGITGFRLRSANDTANVPMPDMTALTPHLDAEALGQLKSKIGELGDRLLSMSEDEFKEWLNALPREEFYEWIALGAEGIGAIIRASRCQAA
jgi:hypothetical protein